MIWLLTINECTPPLQWMHPLPMDVPRSPGDAPPGCPLQWMYPHCMPPSSGCTPSGHPSSGCIPLQMFSDVQVNFSPGCYQLS